MKIALFQLKRLLLTANTHGVLHSKNTFVIGRIRELETAQLVETKASLSRCRHMRYWLLQSCGNKVLFDIFNGPPLVRHTLMDVNRAKCYVIWHRMPNEARLCQMNETVAEELFGCEEKENVSQGRKREGGKESIIT